MSDSQRVAIITGASQGIGESLVTAYRKLGYAVVANSRTIADSDDPMVVTVPGDIARTSVGQRIVDAAMENFGRVDTVVNNAGMFIPKPFTDYTDEDYDAITGVNLHGFFEVSRAAVAAMLSREGGGHIVNISTSLVDHANSAVPSALASLTKGGLNAVTKTLAVEYAGRGIRGQRRRSRGNPNADARSGVLQHPGETSSGRSSRRGRRRCRRGPLSGERALRHRRDPAYGRWPKCRALRLYTALVSTAQRARVRHRRSSKPISATNCRVSILLGSTTKAQRGGVTPAVP
jgi:NADP-dependent 3-hydroxy acid dehydrogenase YdfG